MEGSIGKKRHHPLTLESLQDGFVRDMITRPRQRTGRGSATAKG